MAALEPQSNVDSVDRTPKHDLMNNPRFKSLYEAVSESELGSTIPPPISNVIAQFGWIIMDSKLLTEEEQDYMLEMIESQQQTEKFKCCDWKLLCRASDGDGTQKQFHDACDGKKHTVCLMEVEETGYICGGYASTEWKSTDYNTGAKDDDAFLFVIRPIEKRNVFHRKRHENGDLCRSDGILYNKGDGFNFGYNTLFWGNENTEERRIKMIRISSDTQYFTYESEIDVVGRKGWGCTQWKDYEVFQLHAVTNDDCSITVLCTL